MHATNWDARRTLLNNPRVPDIMAQLATLAEGGIQFEGALAAGAGAALGANSTATVTIAGEIKLYIDLIVSARAGSPERTRAAGATGGRRWPLAPVSVIGRWDAAMRPGGVAAKTPRGETRRSPPPRG